MSIFELLVNILILYVVGLVLKRAVVGPQKNFSRVSSILIFMGGVGVWMASPEKDSIGMHLSAIALLVGSATLVLMFVVENWWMVKQLFIRSKDR